MIAVVNEHAGAIIGPKGDTLSKVRIASGCRVNVEPVPTPDQERLVLISGPADENVSTALDSIITSLFNASHPATAITFCIPPSCVGPFIGRGGSQIKQFRNNSGANVTLKDDSVRILQIYARCEVTGEEDAIRAACAEISQFLYNQIHKEGSPELPDTRALLNNMHMGATIGMMAPAYNTAGMMGYGYFPQPYFNGMTTQVAPMSHRPNGGSMEMLLPKKYLGYLIGKAGKSINSVRQQFSVEVRVEDNDEHIYAPTGEPAALITVTGPRDAVLPACARCVANLVSGNQGEFEPVISESLSIENSSVPRVIGRGGLRINLIRSSSRCKIVVHQPDDAGPSDMATITIEGHTREVVGARMLLEARETGSGNAADHEGQIGSSSSTLEMHVPKKYLGNIIGKAGKSINTVRQTTGCNIQVIDDETSLVDSNGDELAVLTVVGVNSNVSWSAAGQLIGNLNVGNSHNGPDEAQVTTISVPAESVGQIIGRAGARINLIRHCSGCKINVEQPEEGSEAIVTLEGNARQVQAARSLIQARETKSDASDRVHPDAMADQNPNPMVQHLPSVGLGGIFGAY